MQIRSKAQELETPPRTWRRPKLESEDTLRDRNTSTDVEKTIAPVPAASRSKKHLHGRGEDQAEKPLLPGVLETPPRTWRRLILKREVIRHIGNTSTDVEKTLKAHEIVLSIRKHLHGRGEDLKTRFEVIFFHETPPRTWRRQQDLALSHFS